jgi:hypothetical protein
MIEPKFIARAATLLCASLLIAAPASAHHSFAKFDRQRSIELEGELAEVRWQNPHVQYTLRSRGADGKEQTWKLEHAARGRPRAVAWLRRHAAFRRPHDR